MKMLSLFKGEIEVRQDPRPAGGMKTILAQTAQDYGLTPEDLYSLSRKHRIARPRQDFMWRARQVRWADGTPRYSLPQIAGFLGGMDHTTVLHGIRAHQARLDAKAADNG